MSLRGVGIDVADMRRIGRLVMRHGERFTGRWFTTAEIAQVDRSGAPECGFTARFAAKEAVWKSLGLSGSGPVPWRSIAILTEPNGSPTVALSGDVADAARRFGVGSIAISWAINGDVVTALAVAGEGRPAQITDETVLYNGSPDSGGSSA